MNKTILVPIAVAAFVGTSLFVTHEARAFGPWGGDDGQTLIQRLATKFNLNQDEVKVVFDEFHQQKQTAMQQKFADRLNQLVTDGKITEAQKAAILAKHQEMQQQMQSTRDQVKNMTEAERRAFHEQKRAELEQWAKDNNVDLSLFPMMMGKGNKGMGSGPRL